MVKALVKVGTLGGQTGANEGQNGGAYGRLTKVEFPKFDGEEVASSLHRLHVMNKLRRKMVMRILKEEEEEVVSQILLNAMTGMPSYQTMRVKGHVKKHALHLLVNCGSTHNFLDLHAARRLGCKMSKTCPLQVSMANGQVMSSIYECKNFKWTIQGQVFETDVMILPLGGCEMVLGIQ
ncbi:reverse transcriptase [Tanacetum coccineum]